MKYTIYTKSAWEPHIVLLYEWLQNFETKEPTRREWCKLLKKWEQQTHQQPQCELLPSDRCLFCETTQITRKQHAENISQMYDKNSWGFCQRSNNNKKQKNKISTSFWNYQATCQRDYIPEDDRHQETIKVTKTIEEQASNKTIYFQYIIQYVMCRIV